MKFFIPDLEGGPEAAETAWTEFLSATNSSTDSKRVYSMTYEHDARSQKFIVTVGKRRMKYVRQKEPRGARRKDAEYERSGNETGSIVVAIVQDDDLIRVWSTPPTGNWVQAFLVDRHDVTDIEYFEDDSDG